jgi:hypothetical protein
LLFFLPFVIFFPFVIFSSICYFIFHLLFSLLFVIFSSICYFLFHLLFSLPFFIFFICYFLFHLLLSLPFVIFSSICYFLFHLLLSVPFVTFCSICYFLFHLSTFRLLSPSVPRKSRKMCQSVLSRNRDVIVAIPSPLPIIIRSDGSVFASAAGVRPTLNALRRHCTNMRNT